MLNDRRRGTYTYFEKRTDEKAERAREIFRTKAFDDTASKKEKKDETGRTENR